LSYRNLILADNPIGYFPLDEASGNSVTDIVGNRVLSGVTNFQNFQLGATGRTPGTTALRLTGAAMIEGVGTPIPGGSFSFECWIRPDAALEGVPEFTIPAGQTVTHVAYYTALSGGTLLVSKSVTNEVFAAEGTYRLTAGTLTMTNAA
jgi:hypothetical protein